MTGMSEKEMKIETHRHVSIEYTLTDDDGNVVDTTEGREPLSYIHGAKALIAGLEEALEGKTAGETLDVTIPPEKGYGMPIPEMLHEVPIEEMGNIENLEQGMRLQAHTPQGVQVFTVTEIKDEVVVVDGNHPMAGKNLNFNVKVSGVREASEDEIAAATHQCGCSDSGKKDGHSCSSEGGGGGCGC